MARRNFFSLPFFCIEHSLLFTLFSFSYLNFVFVICLFWHTLTARDDTRDRDANSSRQNCVTWCDFLQGKQVELPPSRSLLPQKTKNLPLALSTRENIWARLVAKSTQRPTKRELWESGHLWEGVPWELRRPQADKSSAEDTSGEAARKSFSKKIFAWVTF